MGLIPLTERSGVNDDNGVLFVAEGKGVMGLIPLTERSGVNDDNGVLDQGLGTNQLIVGSVVDNIDDTGLTGHSLAAPGKVALVEAQGAIFLVASSAAEGVDPLGSQLGHSGGAAELELPLLADGGTLATSGAALMPMITRDTHLETSNCLLFAKRHVEKRAPIR